MKLLMNQTGTVGYAIEHIAKVYIFGHTEIWLTLGAGENVPLAVYATTQKCDRAFMNLVLSLDSAPLTRREDERWGHEYRP